MTPRQYCEHFDAVQVQPGELRAHLRIEVSPVTKEGHSRYQQITSS